MRGLTYNQELSRLEQQIALVEHNLAIIESTEQELERLSPDIEDDVYDMYLLSTQRRNAISDLQRSMLELRKTTIEVDKYLKEMRYDW